MVLSLGSLPVDMVDMVDMVDKINGGCGYDFSC